MTDSTRKQRPLKQPIMLVAAAAVILLILGGVFKNRGGAETILGGIGWFGFLACVLLLVLLLTLAAIRARASRR